jgi:hypothetical protein
MLEDQAKTLSARCAADDVPMVVVAGMLLISGYLGALLQRPFRAWWNPPNARDFSGMCSTIRT